MGKLIRSKVLRGGHEAPKGGYRVRKLSPSCEARQGWDKTKPCGTEAKTPSFRPTPPHYHPYLHALIFFYFFFFFFSSFSLARCFFFFFFPFFFFFFFLFFFFLFWPLSSCYFSANDLALFSFQIWYVGFFYGFCNLEFCKFCFFFLAKFCVNVFISEEK